MTQNTRKVPTAFSLESDVEKCSRFFQMGFNIGRCFAGSPRQGCVRINGVRPCARRSRGLRAYRRWQALDGKLIITASLTTPPCNDASPHCLGLVT